MLPTPYKYLKLFAILGYIVKRCKWSIPLKLLDNVGLQPTCKMRYYPQKDYRVDSGLHLG